FIPAQLVYIPYVPSGGEPLLCVPVSTGQACHPDRTQAILTGLYEVVERDAFAISWLRKLPLPRLAYRDDPVLSELYRLHFEGCQLEFHVYDMTLDIGIPSCLCIVEGRSARGPLAGIGAATRLTQREAVTKALLEAAQVMVWCRDLARRRADWRPEPDWS